MKGLAALLAMVVTVLALLVITLVEVVAKLAPVLIVGACIWAGVMVCRARQRRSVPIDTRARAELGSLPALSHCVVPTPTVAPCPASLPPRMQHQERVYVVRGDETGLGSLRPDGYLKVSADQLPPARPIQIGRLRAVGHSGRRRPGTPKTRP